MFDTKCYYIIGYCNNPICKTKNTFCILSDVEERVQSYARTTGLIPKSEQIMHIFGKYIQKANHLLIGGNGSKWDFRIKRNPDMTFSFFDDVQGYVFCHQCHKSKKFCMDEDEIMRLIARLV